MSLVFGGMGLLLGDGVVSSLTQAVGQGTSEATDTYGMAEQGEEARHLPQAPGQPAPSALQPRSGVLRPAGGTREQSVVEGGRGGGRMMRSSGSATWVCH